MNSVSLRQFLREMYPHASSMFNHCFKTALAPYSCIYYFWNENSPLWENNHLKLRLLTFKIISFFRTQFLNTFLWYFWKNFSNYEATSILFGLCKRMHISFDCWVIPKYRIWAEKVAEQEKLISTGDLISPYLREWSAYCSYLFLHLFLSIDSEFCFSDLCIVHRFNMQTLILYTHIHAQSYFEHTQTRSHTQTNAHTHTRTPTRKHARTNFKTYIRRVSDT